MLHTEKNADSGINESAITHQQKTSSEKTKVNLQKKTSESTVVCRVITIRRICIMYGYMMEHHPLNIKAAAAPAVK